MFLFRLAFDKKIYLLKQTLSRRLRDFKMQFFLIFFAFFACNLGFVMLQEAHDK